MKYNNFFQSQLWRKQKKTMMRRFLIGLALVSGSATLPLLQALAVQRAEVSEEELEHTKDSLETVKKKVEEKDAVLVDVRTLKEWDAGHIENAIFLPWAELQRDEDEKKVREKVPKDKIVYTYCESGGRSLMAGEILKKFGYDIRPLKQGHKELKAAGFKSVKLNP